MKQSLNFNDFKLMMNFNKTHGSDPS